MYIQMRELNQLLKLLEDKRVFSGDEIVQSLIANFSEESKRCITCIYDKWNHMIRERNNCNITAAQEAEEIQELKTELEELCGFRCTKLCEDMYAFIRAIHSKEDDDYCISKKRHAIYHDMLILGYCCDQWKSPETQETENLTEESKR